jgi:predicted SAM-dependent methyltransferase
MVAAKRHHRGVKQARKRRDFAPNLHLGCGSRHLDGFLNIDLESNLADLRLDLRQTLPFPSSLFGLIYSEHVLEHFDYPHDITRLLQEILRVLKADGDFIFSIPDG